MFRISLVLSALSLVACGGGGDVAGDVAAMAVVGGIETISCPTTGAAVTFDVPYSINGGQPPFRVRSNVLNSNGRTLELGWIRNQEFVSANVGDFQGGDLIVDGKDPRFGARVTLICGDELGSAISVYDYHSFRVDVTLNASLSED